MPFLLVLSYCGSDDLTYKYQDILNTHKVIWRINILLEEVIFKTSDVKFI